MSYLFLSPLDASTVAQFYANAVVKKLSLHRRELRIGWGKPSPVPSQVTLVIQQRNASRNVYLGGLDENTTEEQLRGEDHQGQEHRFVHFLSVIAVISARIFHHVYPTSKPSLFHFTRSRLANIKTRHKITSYWYKDNKHRLHCTQDGSPQDDLTASSYRLVLLCDTWTPTKATNTVQVFYPCLSLLISLPEDESLSEVPLSGTIGGGVKISPT